MLYENDCYNTIIIFNIQRLTWAQGRGWRLSPPLHPPKGSALSVPVIIFPNLLRFFGGKTVDYEILMGLRPK